MSRRRWIWIALAGTLFAIALVLVGSRIATRQATTVADRSAAALARTHGGLLTSELQKFRLLPLVLAEYPDVARALAGDDRAAAARLDATLELLAGRTDAAALYAVDARGRTVAASNWRLPTSFVGQDYHFRPYFTQAMARGTAEVFALGTVSGRPGLYLARRIDAGGRALGAIVVKVEFDRLEADWARSAGATVVTDPSGVVLVTSVPGWRFRPVHALDPRTLADARRTRQFGAEPQTRPPFTLTGHDALAGGARYRVASTPAPLAGSRLLHLSPLAPPLAAARTTALLAALGLVLVAGIGGGLLVRSIERRRIEARARAALEAAVVERTAALRIESEERAEADRRYRAAREELAQANRLGSLGQITAGVAHEINQPLAAIRTFAENGATLLDRGSDADARANLGRIVALTERIGAITAELRGFARRRTPSGGSATLESIVAGLMLLIGERGRGVVTVDLPPALAPRAVVGDRIRLEQILVNLVQNALDAVEGRADPEVAIGVAEADGIAIRVADNGPGIDPALGDTLFTPFASAKPEGLGLGLAIARDIAREFGGELTLEPSDTGATFLLRLRPA